MRGKSVLLVDTDSQGNVGVSLSVKAERTLYHVVVMGLRVGRRGDQVRDEPRSIAVERDAGRRRALPRRPPEPRPRPVASASTRAAAHYDVIVLDCSPSLSLMNQNALVFADSVLVPVACDYLSLVGVRQVIRTVKNVNRSSTTRCRSGASCRRSTTRARASAARRSRR